MTEGEKIPNKAVETKGLVLSVMGSNGKAMEDIWLKIQVEQMPNEGESIVRDLLAK